MAFTRPWYERGTEPMMLIDLSATANQWAITTSAGGVTYISLSTSLTLPGTLTASAAVNFSGTVGITAAVTLSSALTISGLGSTDPTVLGACWRTTDGLLHVSSGST